MVEKSTGFDLSTMFAIEEGRAIGKALRIACRLSSVRNLTGCRVVEA